MISIQNAAEPVASLVRNARNGMDYRSQWMSAPLSRKSRRTGLLQPANCDSEERSNMLQPAATSNGLLLLERAETDHPPLSTGITPRFTLC